MTEFQNPQQDPGAEKRLLLVFVLTFLVIVMMQPLFNKYGPKKPAAPTQPQATRSEQAAPASPDQAKQPQPAEMAAPSPAPTTARQAEQEAETVIENSRYRITFSNHGARVTSWILKGYTDYRDKPLEMVEQKAAEKFGYPMEFWTYDQDLREKLSTALYVPSATGEQQAPAEITFEYADQHVAARKSFRFDHSYLVEVESEVLVDGHPVPAYPAWPAGFGDLTTPSSFAAQQVVWHQGDKVEHLAAKKVSGGNTLHQTFYWAGVADQYFAAVFLPQSPQDTSLVTLHEAIEIPKNGKAGKDQSGEAKLQQVSVLGAAVGVPDGPTRGRWFVGPKVLDLLENISATAPGGGQGPNLEPLVKFGWFGFLAKPLFLWLKWTHEHWVANWGWSILILTVIINIALLPLRLSSMKSSLKMAKVAPQMKAIQEKYKKYKMNDPRKAPMQQEIAALYKKEGVNPLGGCFPMLLQMPFLFAFYSMLGNAIELRHADWLWLHDLSAPDPWYLLPFGIAISMLWVQRMTPQAGLDPAQQKMMNVMMPVMLGFISASLAAGLGIYWFASNLLSGVQQLVMNRTKFGREVRSEMLKRAAKKRAG